MMKEEKENSTIKETGRKAIVTGSSKGLGLAIAKRLAKEGMDVAIGARSEDSLKKAREQIKDHSGKVVAHTIDFSNAENSKEYMGKVVGELNGLDILVNNVGAYLMDQADDDILKNLEKHLELNLLATVRMTQLALDHMKENGSGTIVNIISIAAKNPRRDAASYSVSKVALASYTDLLREEVKKYGIRVIGIYPGPMDTASWEGVDVDHGKLIGMDEMSDLVYSAVSVGGNSNLNEFVVDIVKDL